MIRFSITGNRFYAVSICASFGVNLNHEKNTAILVLISTLFDLNKTIDFVRTLFVMIENLPQCFIFHSVATFNFFKSRSYKKYKARTIMSVLYYLMSGGF